VRDLFRELAVGAEGRDATRGAEGGCRISSGDWRGGEGGDAVQGEVSREGVRVAAGGGGGCAGQRGRAGSWVLDGGGRSGRVGSGRPGRLVRVSPYATLWSFLISFFFPFPNDVYLFFISSLHLFSILISLIFL
jgi:hypothetical protein